MSMSRTTLAALAAVLAVALLAPPPARADEAAGHYNLCVQFKREGKVAEAIAECGKAISLRSDYAAALSSGRPSPPTLDAHTRWMSRGACYPEAVRRLRRRT